MIKNATAVVICRDGLVLIARRMSDGLWEFPGGRVDDGESPEQCAKREIREELGVEIAIEEKLGVVEGFFRYTDMVVHCFLARILKGKPSAVEAHTDVKWVRKADIDVQDIVEEDRKVLDLF